MPTCFTCGRPKASATGDLCKPCLRIAQNAALSAEQKAARLAQSKAGTARMSAYDRAAMYIRRAHSRQWAGY